jgi:hypothetical protein
LHIKKTIYSGTLVFAFMMVFLGSLSCSNYITPSLKPPVAGDLDSDRDGLSDSQETSIGTNPKKPDTDGDGLLDKYELDAGLNPLNIDTDGDGIQDGDDFLPRVNNIQLYQYLGIGIVVIIIVCLVFYDIRIGLTKKRKQSIQKTKAQRANFDEKIRLESGRIHEYAEEHYGSVTLDELVKGIPMEPNQVKRCLKFLKTKKRHDYYDFPDLINEYSKNRRK